jgi:hypothetical protein
MQTHSSLRKQNAQWFALQKEALRKELLFSAPRDYQDRNWFYQVLAIVISYPLQLVSVLAGAYLLFDVASFVWQLPSYSWATGGVFAVCVLLFVLVESLRRWLVDTVGFHYLATFYVEGKDIVHGEWLRTKILVLFCISVGLVSSGTFGAYQYSKNHAPQAETIDLKQATSPLSAQIKAEKQHIEQLNKNITDLQQNKKKELHDHKSYAIWEGKEYLLPEVKIRHQNYDTQIAQMQRQAQAHLEILQKYEQKLSSKEQVVEQKNQEILSFNRLSKEQYAVASAGIWLGFEALLLFSLAYLWLYRYGVKRELLLEQATLGVSSKTQAHAHRHKKTFSDSPRSVGTFSPKTATATDAKKTASVPIIGFEVGKKHDRTPHASLETDTVPTETVRVERVVETEGFPIVCRNCGTSAVMRSPHALHCSNKCRKEYFKKRREAGEDV